jgi:hypothetical protein
MRDRRGCRRRLIEEAGGQPNLGISPKSVAQLMDQLRDEVSRR